MASIPQLKPDRTADAATQYFLDQVRQMPGVLRVEASVGEARTQARLIIYVPEGDLETEKRVYELKLAVYQCHPTARLDVWVEPADLAVTEGAAGIGS